MRSDNGCTADLEISSVENLPQQPAKWTLCGSNGTLMSDGTHSTIRWFDPTQVEPLIAVDGPAADRKYGNADQLPWQEKTVPAIGPDVGSFYDNVFAVLRNSEPMRVTPESVREVMRVIALIRKRTKLFGKAATGSTPRITAA